MSRDKGDNKAKQSQGELSRQKVRSAKSVGKCVKTENYSSFTPKICNFMKNVFFEKTRIKNEIKVFSDIIIAKSESYFKEQIFLWNKMVKMKSEEFFGFMGKCIK